MLVINFCAFFIRFFLVSTYDVDVDLKQGKLLGASAVTLFDGNLYLAFYGVPYAQPPIGKLRFKNPKPPKKWSKPFDARTEYHGACAQAHIVHKHGIYGTEDCLYLNIYTPSLYKRGNRLKAVIVWIHGYSFTSSFSHIHGPDFFIDEDVILVTMTHRIGALGFLKLNETDENANMGLKDIVMGLKWIRKNIKQFGGSKNVTVMSSGSAATLLSLLMTTKSEKLFSKIILQSGAIFSPSLFQGNPKLENERLKQILKRKGYDSINEASVKDIVEASRKIYSNADVINAQRPLIPFLPIIETESNSSLLTKHPEVTAYHSDKQDYLIKPILIGFNSKESISEVIPFLHNPLYLRSLALSFKYMVPFTTQCKYNYSTSTYKIIANTIKNGYFNNSVSEKSVDRFIQYTSDLIKYPIYRYIQKRLQIQKSITYVYKFTYSGTFNIVKANSIAGVNSKIKGAASGDEICYMLKCEPIWEYYVKVNRDFGSRDKIFIKRITKMWANFAKTGDPTPNTITENVTWPQMTANDDKMLNIGKVINIVDSKKEKRMFVFWNDIYQKYYRYCGPREEL